LFLLWIFETGIRPALGFHFLGVTAYVLLCGWSLGVIGVSLAMVAVTFTTGDWAALAANALLLGVLPASISYGVYALVTHYLPRHLFVYIFLCAFFNAMLAAGAAVLALLMSVPAAILGRNWRRNPGDRTRRRCRCGCPARS
jgi:uncharacterized membrane protein